MKSIYSVLTTDLHEPSCRRMLSDELYDVARRAAAAVITAVAPVVTNFTLENDESTGACAPSAAYSSTATALALRYSGTATAGPGPATRDDL